VRRSSIGRFYHGGRQHEVFRNGVFRTAAHQDSPRGDQGGKSQDLGEDETRQGYSMPGFRTAHVKMLGLPHAHPSKTLAGVRPDSRDGL